MELFDLSVNSDINKLNCRATPSQLQWCHNYSEQILSPAENIDQCFWDSFFGKLLGMKKVAYHSAMSPSARKNQPWSWEI